MSEAVSGPGDVLIKRCSEKMLQIHRKKIMQKFDFNKVAFLL